MQCVLLTSIYYKVGSLNYSQILYNDDKDDNNNIESVVPVLRSLFGGAKSSAPPSMFGGPSKQPPPLPSQVTRGLQVLPAQVRLRLARPQWPLVRSSPPSVAMG